VRGPEDFSKGRFAARRRRGQVKALTDFSPTRFAGSGEKRFG
jgi:hypothetical protein